MEKLSNQFQLLQWRLRSLLRIPQKTVAPIIWRPPLITSKHHPTPEFIKKSSEMDQKKIQKILQELEIFSKLSIRFPRKLSDSDWRIFLELESRKSRMDHLEFRFKKEKLERQDERKKWKNSRNFEEKNGEKIDFPPKLILNFQSSKTEKYQKFRSLINNFRLENSPILAVDCQFLPHLSPRGRGLTALQLQYLATKNREYPEPFRLFFVNYDKENERIEELEKDKLKFLEDPEGISPICEKRGLRECFGPSKKIIYLSPDAPEELETVEDDAVYVIGGIVDRVVEPGIPKNASLEAAESAGVLARKLPIDRYIDFKSGSRFLTLLAVAEILRQVNLHGNWQSALESAIPVRNRKGPQEKSQVGRDAQKRIHEFNREILRRMERKLGKDERE